MSVRQKYAFNGICFFENAREHMERDGFPDNPIGTIGRCDGTFSTMLRIEKCVKCICEF